MKRNKKTVIFLAMIMLVTCLGVYTVAIPRIMAVEYSDRVRALAKPLQSNFNDIRQSTELPLLTDPYVSEAAKASSAAYIKQLIGSGRQKLGLLRATSTSLEVFPYSGVLGQYGEAKAMQDHTQWLIAQSEAALNDYEHLIVYLETFNKVRDSVVAELNAFNQVADINIYGGQSASLRQIAGQVRADATLLNGVKRPIGTDPLNTATIAALDEAAGGFEDLADGLMIPADGPIYEAARKIEDATSKLDAVMGEMYSDSFEQSRIIKNIQDLNEKLELILEI